MDKVEYGVFWHSRASNSKVNSPILSAFKLIWDFMPVQCPVICNFHITSSSKMIKSKVKALSSGQDFLHYKSMGNFLSLKGE